MRLGTLQVFMQNDYALRLPDMARVTLARFQMLVNHHPSQDQVVAGIDQRCAPTIRRLTQKTARHPLPRVKQLIRQVPQLRLMLHV